MYLKVLVREMHRAGKSGKRAINEEFPAQSKAAMQCLHDRFEEFSSTFRLRSLAGILRTIGQLRLEMQFAI